MDKLTELVADKLIDAVTSVCAVTVPGKTECLIVFARWCHCVPPTNTRFLGAHVSQQPEWYLDLSDVIAGLKMIMIAK